MIECAARQVVGSVPRASGDAPLGVGGRAKRVPHVVGASGEVEPDQSAARDKHGVSAPAAALRAPGRADHLAGGPSHVQAADSRATGARPALPEAAGSAARGRAERASTRADRRAHSRVRLLAEGELAEEIAAHQVSWPPRRAAQASQSDDPTAPNRLKTGAAATWSEVATAPEGGPHDAAASWRTSSGACLESSCCSCSSCSAARSCRSSPGASGPPSVSSRRVSKRAPTRSRTSPRPTDVLGPVVYVDPCRPASRHVAHASLTA